MHAYVHVFLRVRPRHRPRCGVIPTAVFLLKRAAAGKGGVWASNVGYTGTELNKILKYEG